MQSTYENIEHGGIMARVIATDPAELPGLVKYADVTVREAGEIAESLGISLLALLGG